MPKINGIEALKQMREIYHDGRVVMVSSVETQDTLLDAIKLGATDFIQKPYTDLQIKNIDHEKVLKLTEEISVAPGQIVSKTLAQNDAVSVTLFAFSKGEEIGEHDSTGDAFVHVLEGKGKFTVGGVEHIVSAGEVLVMPAKIPHAVYGEEDFKWILTVVFPRG